MDSTTRNTARPQTTIPVTAAGDALVSCLCVTHDRVPMLRRSVAGFLAQSHGARELVVVHESRDTATAAFLRGLNEPAVREIELPPLPRLTLGAKRNRGLAACRGTHIAVWDDDDWHAPSRLAVQLEVLKLSGQSACTLRQTLVLDEVTGDCYLSQTRAWECTLFATRAAMPLYADLERGEDVPGVVALARSGQLTLVDAPQLYVYVYHGRNAGNRAHFRRNIFAHSRKLPPAFAGRVRTLLQAPTTAAPLTATEIRGLLAPQA
ncbi:MAG: glycosyltransferase family A protein [Polaromonas sp.]|nr:glycosyltransferase family A protein [Polaromonas sp.]